MDIMYTPSYTILAAGILLIIPIVFHLAAFRKSVRFIHILTSILVGNFILAFVSEIAGLAHFFDAKIILILSLLVAGVLGYWINKKSVFEFDKENIGGNRISKTCMFLVMGTAIFVFLLQKNMFPPFNITSVSTYLPWARTIVEQGSIPAFDVSCWRYVVHYPLFLYTTTAFLFSFFGTYVDSIVAAIPILYLCFFVFLITNWGEEYAHADRNTSFFIIFSLLLSPYYFTRYSAIVSQETPLLFFATASFYLLFKYLRTKETIFLVLLSVSSALMSLTKYSGLVISAMLFCIAIIGTREKKEIHKIFMIFPLIHIPNILWAIRNFYYFNNPVYPALTSIFKNSIYSNLTACKLPTYFDASSIHTMYPISPQEMAIGFFIVFPAFIFTIFYMFRNRKEGEVQYIVACFVVFLLFLYISGWRLLVRYLYPFLGVFALYAGIEMSKWYNAIPIEVIKRKKNAIIKASIIFLCIMTLLSIPFGIGNTLSNIKTGNYKSIANDIDPNYLDPREPHFQSVFKNESEVLDYLQRNEKGKNLIIFGELTYVLNWYGNYTSLYPFAKSFLVLNHNINKEPFDFTKNSTYMYNKLQKLGVDYVYDSATWEQSLEKILFDKINQDTEHFELVYDKNGYRLWKLKYR